MDIYDLNLYKIPSDAIIQNRQIFYALLREHGESTKAWLKRVQFCINRCEFPEFIEYLLIDKFICELNRNENEYFRMAHSWTLKQLNKYFMDVPTVKSKPPV